MYPLSSRSSCLFFTVALSPIHPFQTLNPKQANALKWAKNLGHNALLRQEGIKTVLQVSISRPRPVRAPAGIVESQGSAPLAPLLLPCCPLFSPPFGNSLCQACRPCRFSHKPVPMPGMQIDEIVDVSQAAEQRRGEPRQQLLYTAAGLQGTREVNLASSLSTQQPGCSSQ